jgi:hypothetical protein
MIAKLDAPTRPMRGASGHRRATSLLALALFAIAACTGAGSSATPTSPPSIAPSNPPSVAASATATAAASIVPSATAGPGGSQAACVDVGTLADQGDPAMTAMQAIKPALAAQKVDDARTHAQTAIKGMKSMADLVAAASPQGQQLFLKAADELIQAAAQFPAGTSLVDQAQADLDQAFVIARASKCAD